MSNITQIDPEAFNITAYPSIMKFTNLSSYDAIFTPFTDIWIAQVYGAWWWVLVLFVTVGTTLVKSKEIFPTAFVLLIVSAILSQAVPPEIQTIMYLLMVLGFFGALYGWFEDRNGGMY